MDSIIKLKELFRSEEVTRDNFLFRLHHQANFFVISFGVLFIFGENYLGDSSIECKDGDDYTHKYCWLHGASHLPADLSQVISGCRSNQGLGGVTGGKHTHYYLWLPFILGICMFLVKIPRFIWKHIFERDLMRKILDHRDKMEKLVEKINTLRSKRIFFYCFGFAFCEILNIASVLICLLVFDKLLGGKYLSYGADYIEYYLNGDEGSEGRANPLCHVFPTEVSCNVGSGAIVGGGNVDNKNVLCILSNNLFNQYYFFILWLWWTLLIIISVIALLYRLIVISIPWVAQEWYLLYHDVNHGNAAFLRSKTRKPWDWFFLSRLFHNLNGEEMEQFFEEFSTNNNKSVILE